MAQDDISKAMKGSKNAMLALFSEHGSKVVCLCRSLLLDENEANAAAIYVFKTVYSDLISGRISSSEEFGKLAVRKAILYCKTKVLKKSNRDFRVPANSNFTVTCEADKIDLNCSEHEVVLRNLPNLHRFIYVIDLIAGYSASEIAHIFSMAPKAVEKALEAEALNIGRIAAAASRAKGIPSSVDIDEFRSQLVKDALSMQIPESVSKSVAEEIEEICTPLQKKEKQKRLIIIAIAVAIIAAIAIIIGTSLGGGESNVDLDNAHLTPAASDDVSGANSDTVVSDEQSTYDDAVINSEFEATHYAEIAIDDYGTITVALDANIAPETVENFVSLANSGFYDGLTFHRIMEGFMMQGGAPDGNDTGGSDKTITGEFAANGFENPLSHTRGAISMARSNDYNSASSQFFIVHEDSSYSLDGLYACFGYVIGGMDIVDAICTEAEPTDSNGTIPAENQPVITSIVVSAAEPSAPVNTEG